MHEFWIPLALAVFMRLFIVEVLVVGFLASARRIRLAAIDGRGAPVERDVQAAAHRQYQNVHFAEAACAGGGSEMSSVV